MLKVTEPGRTTKRIPANPTINASQRGSVTFSPSIATDKRVIISGAEKRIVSTSASGRAASPMKAVVYERKRKKPRTYSSMGCFVVGSPRPPS
jgi:hypothetical protein